MRYLGPNLKTVNHLNNGHGLCTRCGDQLGEHLSPGGIIRKLLVSLLGAATLTAGVFIVRQHQKEVAEEAQRQVPAGEKVARDISLERLRELGL